MEGVLKYVEQFVVSSLFMFLNGVDLLMYRFAYPNILAISDAVFKRQPKT
jgi:hypothetical protein